MPSRSNIVFCAAFVSVIGSATLADTSGPLNVSTEVASTCSAPDPQGSLNVSLNPRRDFDQQSYSNVTVDITCQGGAEVDSISFTNGDNANATYRGLDNANNDILYYELIASYSPAKVSPVDNGVDEMGVSGTTNTYVPLAPSSPALVMHAAIRGADLSDNTSLANDEADQVPEGTYTDTVTITLTLAASS